MSNLGHDIKEKDFIPEEALLTEKEKRANYDNGRLTGKHETLDILDVYVRDIIRVEAKYLAEAEAVGDKASEIWADGAIWALTRIQMKIAEVRR